MRLSRTTCFHSVEEPPAIGLERVGELKARMPRRAARIRSRSMWNGSLTRTAELIPRR